MSPVAKLSTLVLLMLIPSAAQAVEADALVNDQERFLQLIAELDSNSFATRDRAQKALRTIGQPCLSELNKALADSSGELSKRLRILIPQIEQDFFRSAIDKFVRQKDKDLDIEEGMWLISCIADPHVQREDLTRQLDELADKVRQQLGDIDPKKAEPKVVVDKLMQALFAGNDGFYGNMADYQNPQNSSIYHVLRKRTGLPILLSHVVVSVANRLEIPIVGIGVPSRYMALYPASLAPVGTKGEDIIIDPFGGQLLTKEGVKELIPSFDPKRDLIPTSNRAVLVRMLNNIAVHYYRNNDEKNGQSALRFQQALVKHAENPKEFAP